MAKLLNSFHSLRMRGIFAWLTVWTVTSLVLASASPARLTALRAAGLDPEVIVSGVDESLVEASSASALCAALARLKAESVADRLNRAALVLGCDSLLEFDGEILGKPRDTDEAVHRWHRLRGRSGTLHTGHCLIRTDNQLTAEAVGSTVVHFAEATDDDIAAYVGTGEPLQVAGSFTIDGLGGWWVDRIEGDAGTVIGVSLPVLRRLLAQVGVRVIDLWPQSVRSGA
jgi:septum formation protein